MLLHRVQLLLASSTWFNHVLDEQRNCRTATLDVHRSCTSSGAVHAVAICTAVLLYWTGLSDQYSTTVQQYSSTAIHVLLMHVLAVLVLDGMAGQPSCHTIQDQYYKLMHQ